MIGLITNHLWQSTLFGVAVALLAFAFRKNGAHVRYWLWLSASLKFLLPFSLLMGLGSTVHWAPVAKQMPIRDVTFTMAQVAQPFPETQALALSAPHRTHWLLAALLAAWACGFAVIVVMRLRDWLRIRALLRGSTPLPIPVRADVRSCAGLLEPGVVGLGIPGLSRPVLLLPAGIVERLTPAQLQAVLAHELSHIQRRDNFTAAMHMIVEAVFWFHPLVWWIGARLVEERERACDEEVLRLGSAPRDYAQAILSICKLYTESPLACVSGISGSEIKARIEQIVRNSMGEKLTPWRKFVLATAAMAMLALPVLLGTLRAPVWAQTAKEQSGAVPQWETDAGGKMTFEVASVKQNAAPPNVSRPYVNVIMDPMDAFIPTGGLFSATNVPFIAYLGFAYKIYPAEFAGIQPQLPKWANNNRYDIQAHAAGNATKDQLRLMLQALLADRFKLTFHYETREVPVYALVLDKPGKLGPRLRPHPNDSSCSNTTIPRLGEDSTADGYPSICGIVQRLVAPSVPGRLRAGGRDVPLEMLIRMMVNSQTGLDRPIIDKTGLKGKFDLDVEYTPDVGPDPNFQRDESGPSYIEAMKEQLGLKLEATKGPIDFMIIDHIEEPSAN